MTADTVRRAARDAHRLGLCVFPPREDGTKRPDGRWNEYQGRLPTTDEVEDWYSHDRTGLGVITGAVSGNLEMLEFEGRAVAEDVHKHFFQLAGQAGLSDLLKRILTGYLDRSPGGGLRMFYRISDSAPPGNTKLAERPANEAERAEEIERLVGMGRSEEEARRVADRLVMTMIETRGEGGFAVVPPSHGSVHPSGRAWEQIKGGFATLATITRAERDRLVDIARQLDEAPPKPTVQRKSEASSPAQDWVLGLMQRHGWEEHHREHGGAVIHLTRPGKRAEEGSSASIGFRGPGIVHIFSSSTGLPDNRPIAPLELYALLELDGDEDGAARELRDRGLGWLVAIGPETPPHTDDGNAIRFARRHGHDLIYATTGKWHVWDGRRWLQDDQLEAERRARDTALAIMREADGLDPDDENDAKIIEKIESWCRRSQSARALTDMPKIARSIMAFDHERFDADPWLLNCRNGVVDLRTGDIRPHRRSDLHTKLTGVDCDLEAEHPGWTNFLNEVFESDQEMIGFVQRMAGYAATGLVGDHKFPIPYGTGRNGKSVFVGAITSCLGDYAQVIPAATLLSKRNEGIPNDVARLRGARLAVASEPDAGKWLAEGLVKQLTGGDRLVARYMRQEFFEFTPTHKLWLVTNHKPRTSATDVAMWERILLVPFNVFIPRERRVPDLDKILIREEGPAILGWIVKGAIEWGQRRLDPPEKVTQATEEYQAEEDVIGHFLDECVERLPLEAPVKNCVSATDMYRTYRAWCRINGHSPMTKIRLGRELKDSYDVTVGKRSSGHFYRAKLTANVDALELDARDVP